MLPSICVKAVVLLHHDFIAVPEVIVHKLKCTYDDTKDVFQSPDDMAALQVDHQCLRLHWHSWHHVQLDQEQHAPSITPYMPPHHLAPRGGHPLMALVLSHPCQALRLLDQPIHCNEFYSRGRKNAAC